MGTCFISIDLAIGRMDAVAGWRFIWDQIVGLLNACVSGQGDVGGEAREGGFVVTPQRANILGICLTPRVRSSMDIGQCLASRYTRVN